MPGISYSLIRYIKDRIASSSGKSAYQIAVDNGFIGNEAEWLLSLQGSVAELTPEQLMTISQQVDISGKVDKVTGCSLVPTTEILKIHALNTDNQDLSNLVVKVTGKGLSTNDLTNDLKASYDEAVVKGGSILELGDLATNAYPGDKGKTAYDHSQVVHAPSDAVALTTVKIDTDIASAILLKHSNSFDHSNSLDHSHTNKTQLDLITDGDHDVSVHAPSDAQKNSNITKAEIEAKLTGPISTHSHTGGADPFLAKLILLADKPTGANVTPVTLGLSFNYEANSKYVIDIYAIVAPTAASTGCGFSIDTDTVVTYVGTFVSHQLAITGTLSGSGSIGGRGVTSSGVSSGMVSTASQFVYGGGILITGANAGVATFFFRSETTAVTTCKAGTMIRVMKI